MPRIKPLIRPDPRAVAVLTEIGGGRAALQITQGELAREGYLDSGERIFTERDIEVLPYRIRSFQKARRDSDERLFVRSTVCWPAKYVEMACPAVVPLYEEIRGLIG